MIHVSAPHGLAGAGEVEGLGQGRVAGGGWLTTIVAMVSLKKLVVKQPTIGQLAG